MAFVDERENRASEKPVATKTAERESKAKRDKTAVLPFHTPL